MSAAEENARASTASKRAEVEHKLRAGPSRTSVVPTRGAPLRPTPQSRRPPGLALLRIPSGPLAADVTHKEGERLTIDTQPKKRPFQSGTAQTLCAVSADAGPLNWSPELLSLVRQHAVQRHHAKSMSLRNLWNGTTAASAGLAFASSNGGCPAAMAPEKLPSTVTTASRTTSPVTSLMAVLNPTPVSVTSAEVRSPQHPQQNAAPSCPPSVPVPRPELPVHSSHQPKHLQSGRVSGVAKLLPELHEFPFALTSEAAPLLLVLGALPSPGSRLPSPSAVHTPVTPHTPITPATPTSPQNFAENLPNSAAWGEKGRALFGWAYERTPSPVFTPGAVPQLKWQDPEYDVPLRLACLMLMKEMVRGASPFGPHSVGNVDVFLLWAESVLYSTAPTSLSYRDKIGLASRLGRLAAWYTARGPGAIVPDLQDQPARYKNMSGWQPGLLTPAAKRPRTNLIV